MKRLASVCVLLVAGACAPVSPSVPAQAADQPWRCDAQAARSLIGAHVGAVTFPQDANVRLVCSGCPMTSDYRADRLTVVHDADTGLIERVECV